MPDEKMLSTQNMSDKLFVDLFLYSKNIKINRPRMDNEVAV